MNLNKVSTISFFEKSTFLRVQLHVEKLPKNKDENITRSKIDSTKVNRVPVTQILNGTKKKLQKVPVGGSTNRGKCQLGDRLEKLNPLEICEKINSQDLYIAKIYIAKIYIKQRFGGVLLIFKYSWLKYELKIKVVPGNRPGRKSPNCRCNKIYKKKLLPLILSSQDWL